MSKICQNFDAYYAQWHREIGSLCFLLTRDRRGADYACFQSFLRLGGRKNPDIEKDEARTLLFLSALRLSDDFYLKKMRRMPKLKALQEQPFPFEITPHLYAFLKLPFPQRAALALSLYGFSASEIASLLGRSESAAQRLLADPGILGWQDAVRSTLMDEDEALVLSDRIYERFSERTVPVENAIHDFRNAFDRAAPYLALGVLALFAFSVWFVSR